MALKYRFGEIDKKLNLFTFTPEAVRSENDVPSVLLTPKFV